MESIEIKKEGKSSQGVGGVKFTDVKDKYGCLAQLQSSDYLRLKEEENKRLEESINLLKAAQKKER